MPFASLLMLQWRGLRWKIAVPSTKRRLHNELLSSIRQQKELRNPHQHSRTKGALQQLLATEGSQQPQMPAVHAACLKFLVLALNHLSSQCSSSSQLWHKLVVPLEHGKRVRDVRILRCQTVQPDHSSQRPGKTFKRSPGIDSCSAGINHKP